MRLLPTLLFIIYFQIIGAQNTARLLNAEGNLFKVYYKNKVINAQAQVEVVLANYIEDTLTLKIESENKSTYGITLLLLEKGKKTKNKEFDYTIAFAKNKVNLSFVGIYDIYPIVSPIVPVKPTVDTSLKYRNKRYGNFCELKDNKPIYFSNLPKSGTCKTPMPSENLAYIRLLMTKAQSDSEKYKIAFSALSNNCVDVEQLNNVLSYIDFEIERLKLVKLCYFNVTDTANKKEIEKNFRFESSKIEFYSFLKQSNEKKMKSVDNCKVASSDDFIRVFTDSLAVLSNDSERLSKLKKECANYCFSTTHISDIVKVFLHDREKLDVAKHLYPYCVDKNSYAQLNTGFSFIESQTELNNFIQKQNK